MALNKDKLNKLIQDKMDEEVEAYKSSLANAESEDDIEPLTTEPVADAVVEHVHEEVETKLETLIGLNTDLISLIQQTLPTIAPPGFGGTGAATFSPQASKLQAELAKLRADLRRSTT